MNALDMVSTGALMLLGIILLTLVLQTLRLREIWQMMLDGHRAARRTDIGNLENKELRSALRAEKAHVDQLRRKLELLQLLIPAVSGEQA
ncbi:MULTISPECIES: hypothetical protein [Pseudomonas]|uniref:hypothetical protein n=1 Tax=Pseudomonas TaxID=286 RepID=UPI000316D85C|nr:MULTISPECIES: hypothetical protein [Pseudomonas]AIG03220.1 hypothetical protein HZ99_13990 [Pseudomonas fluorescens]MBF4558934.1 hypothetical protein [Pseudomonas sp. p50(2008)]